jgi:hypothetical protein
MVFREMPQWLKAFRSVQLFGPGLLRYRSNVLGCVYFINHFRLMMFQDCVSS